MEDMGLSQSQPCGASKHAATDLGDTVEKAAGGSWLPAEEVNALVRRLDVALNGEDGAAPQASLCDIVGQAECLGPRGWQSMKTAPRDGTEVDLWRNGERLTDYSWSDARGAWTKKIGYPVVTNVLTAPPTHWMPSPAAPPFCGAGQ